MNTDNNETSVANETDDVQDLKPQRYEDLVGIDRAYLAKRCVLLQDSIKKLIHQQESYEERIKAAVDAGSRLSDRLEKIEGRTFDEWLKGWVDDRVTERVREEMADLNLDVEDISGLTDQIHETAGEAANEQIGEMSASDLYGLDDLIREQAEEVFDNKIGDVSVEVEARIVT